MKPNVADYRSRIYAVRIESVSGEIARFVEYPHDLPMTTEEDPVDYNSGSGYEFTNLSATSDSAPSVIDFRGILVNAVGYLDRDEVASRVWDGAKAYLFATTWSDPIEDEEPLGKFLLGKAQVQDDRYIFEMMSLIDAANQYSGRSIGPLCTSTLFDETLDGVVIPWTRSRCTGPRANPDGPSLAANIVTGTITHVTSRTIFRDSGRFEQADWFGTGAIRFTTGGNAGLSSEEIKRHIHTGIGDNGTIEVYQAWPRPVEVGDEYEMIPGCRTRRVEDCYGKWGNVINHQGFDRVPVSSVYQSIGTGAA
jgi:hypothetical protein